MTAKMKDLTVTVMQHGGWGAWIKVHVSPTLAADEAARKFLGRMPGEIDMDSVDNDLSPWPELTQLYFPICEHGMDGNLCYGPQHYPMDNQL